VSGKACKFFGVQSIAFTSKGTVVVTRLVYAFAVSTSLCKIASALLPPEKVMFVGSTETNVGIGLIVRMIISLHKGF
jgi:hypothetical protein